MADDTCHGCDKPITQPHSGRRRKWCSESCRKRTCYSGSCVDCGARTAYSGQARPSDRCIPCANALNGIERMHWTREAILNAIREWTKEYGSPPTTLDWGPTKARELGRVEQAQRFEEAGGRWPWFTGVVAMFGRWNTAITEAGFEPRRAGGRQP